MKNVCESCEYHKDKVGHIYCVKYGVPIWKERIYCIAWKKSTERREDGNLVLQWQEVPQQQD